jgi:hypothetical protein
MQHMTTYCTEKKITSPRFIDYIRMLPSSRVFQHFLKKNDVRRRILSSSAIQDGVRDFSRADALRRQFETLDPARKLACSLVYLQGASGLLASPGGVDHLKDPLVRSFLVYVARNKSGVLRYFGFPEFEAALRTLCADTLVGAGVVRDTMTMVSKVPLSASQQINDMATVAVLALQGVLAKKKQGGMTRNTLHAIARLTHEGSECSANLLIYCGLQTGILRENTMGYSLAGGEFEAWLSRPADIQLAELVRCASTFAGSWCVELLHETLRRSGGSWLSCSIFPEGERTAAVDTFRILRWAGLVELSRTGSETMFGAVREKTAGLPSKKNGAVVVLPDFTAVIAQEATPEHLYDFGHIGALQSLDRVYKGAIDRRILNNSLASGLRADRVFARLAEWQAPANVVATIREWIREFYRLYIAEGQVLVATDEKVAFEIGSYGPLRDYLEPVPAHTLFRIRPGAEAAVREILGNIGYDYRMPCRDRVAVDEKRSMEIAGVLSEAWEPVVTAAGEPPKPALPLRGKKYGTGLKFFDLNEMLHVIDYAILTGQELMIDYGGSPLLRKAVYTMTPLSRTTGAEPVLEGTLNGGRKKKFSICKISRIGVGVS